MEKKNDHSWMDVRHDSLRLYSSDDRVENKKHARCRRPQLKTVTCIVGKPLQMHDFIRRQTPYWAGSFAMFGLSSRSRGGCRRDWGFRVVVLGAQKSLQSGLRKVILSGFPTALGSTLRRLWLGTNASTLRSDRKVGPLLVPRDDIPLPPPVVVALEVCRLRLARI